MYRQLSQQEIKTLEIQGCSSDNWNNIRVKDPFIPERLKNVQFAGEIKVGSNIGKAVTDFRISKPATISNCYIKDCTIGDNAFLSNIANLVNYHIGNNVAIENVGTLAVTGKTTFGNGHQIEILNEAGGRELVIFDRLTAQIAYLMVIYRHELQLIKKLRSIISLYVQTLESEIGMIGENTKIFHTKTIKNVNIGPYSRIRGALILEEGTIKSNESAPVFIGEGVTASNFIVLSGSKINTGAILTSAFVGQGVQMGKQFSAENSAFFANCEAFHSEACSIFAGPYTVTHHKSTLLIAALFSFYNAGSGTNQSNHMYKLGPVHQGILERGSKTGSFSYMLWPCRIGAFSVVMDKHAGNFDTSGLPFSYISLQDGKSVITPAMNLFTVGTVRDGKKWPERDNRKDNNKADLINFEIFNPYTAGKMIEAVNLLDRLHGSAPKNRVFISHKGININRLMLRTSKRFYELAIIVYLTGELVKRLEHAEYKTIEELRRILSPADIIPKQTKWIDLAGMLIEKERVEGHIGSVINGKIKNIDQLIKSLHNSYSEYAERSYSWCVATLKNFMGIDLNTISKTALIDLLGEWKNNTIKVNNMVLKDAEKEFDQLSRISFGHDGDEDDRVADFEAIRGKYETNSFISSLRKESEKIESLYMKLVEKIDHLPG